MAEDQERTFYPELSGWTKQSIYDFCKGYIGDHCFELSQLTDEDAQEFVDQYYDDIEGFGEYDEEVKDAERDLAYRFNHKLQIRFTEW